MKTITKRYWQSLRQDSAEQVVAHALWRRSRNKRPSMSFSGIQNARHALAEAYVALAEKAEAKERSRQALQSTNRLSPSEIEELLRFEFDAGPVSVEGQLRRYYLQLKDRDPKAAERMALGLALILSESRNLDNIRKICLFLHKYWSGFLIRFQGQSYTFSTRCGFEKI